MGYNQKKKLKKIKQQRNSIIIQQGGVIAKPGKGCRRGNNKPKILTRRMKKVLAELQEEEDSELLELQEQMLGKSSDAKSKKPKVEQVSTEHADESTDDETEECPMEM